MARNDTEATKQESGSRKSVAEIQEYRSENRKRVIEKALLADKVRYKSSCDSTRFQEFLQSRLSFWDLKKEDTFHAKKMYEKTKAILADFHV